jgi:thiol:disulfide interchange protein DsbC
VKLKNIALASFVLAGLPAASFASSDPACGSAETYKWLLEALNKTAGETLAITSVSPSPVFGLCEIELSKGGSVYASPASKSIIAGTVFSVSQSGDLVNLTQKALFAKNQKLLMDIPEADYIAFKPEGKPKAVVYAMIDTDCGYCTKLHEESEQHKAAGIEVRYLPFVRGGAEGAAYSTMSSTWCGKDREAKLHLALTGNPVEGESCSGEEILNRNLELGEKVQLRGTPHLIFEDGSTVSGYMPTAELAKTAIEASNAALKK